MLISLLLSSLVHGAVAAPYIAWSLTAPPVTAGEDGPEDRNVGDGAVGDGGAPSEPTLTPPAPVNISVYVEPIAPPSPSPELQASTSTAAKPTSGQTTSGQTTSRPTRGSGEGTSPGKETNSGVEGSPAPGPTNSCEPVDSITKIGTKHWRVDRELVDYYASHLRELDRQASTSTHRDDAGKPDGILIYLPRCSVIRHGGLRNGDVIHTVNGRKVSNVANAVTTYLAVRKEKNINVLITRKNGRQVTLKYRLK
ncbi:MAG: hypothetical protein P8R54_02965 [Myxococcota bacterium]|nr:hypothetical protein [Myxococcota bacterium]